MLLLDQRTLQIKYRVPASEIYRMSLSPYLDDIAVFHVKAVSVSLYSSPRHTRGRHLLRIAGKAEGVKEKICYASC